VPFYEFVKDLSRLKTLDILEVVKKRPGYRLSLDRLAEKRLGVTKSAEGRIDKIVEYRRRDVAITRDLLLFACENGHLLLENKAGQVCPLPVSHWLWRRGERVNGANVVSPIRPFIFTGGCLAREDFQKSSRWCRLRV
jgi:hypothetical protein